MPNTNTEAKKESVIGKLKNVNQAQTNRRPKKNSTKHSAVEQSLTPDNYKLIRKTMTKVYRETGMTPSNTKVLNLSLNAKVLDKVADDLIAKYK